MRRILLVLLSLTAAATVRPAAAFHCPEDYYDEYHDTNFSQVAQTGWAAYRIQVAPLNVVSWGASVQTFDSSDVGVGTWVLKGDGSLAEAWVEASTSSGQGVLVHVQAVDSGFVVDRHVAPSRGGFGIATSGSLEPGTYTIVMAVSGERGVAGEAAVCGVGFTVLGSTQGEGGFFAGDRDFSGAVNVAAGTPRAFGGVGGYSAYVPALAARVAESASVTRLVEHAFFGAFLTGLTDVVTDIGYDGPNGSHDGEDEYLFAGAAAGTYHFREELAVGAGFSGTWAFGADVVLP